MASDYYSIRKDNERRYGTDIDRIGSMLLSGLYDNRTHFIFEILQNAEDALTRRAGSHGAQEVRFTLCQETLKISHFGQPFNDRDVRGICGIAESTKDLTDIGRFGIGFKSVYALTKRPEVHSGEEDFAIESYVWPTAVPATHRETDETVFILPLRAEDETAHADIVEGLRRLGPRTLLFLRQIEEITWRVEGGPSGLYLRGKEKLDDNIRRITLVGEEDGEPDVEQTWLVFSREARTNKGPIAGYVEVAFLIGRDEESDRELVETVSDSSLVVFFPTVLPTHLGFLVQGPYRTTPSRDNVPRNDPWNEKLVEETASLLVEALRWLRDNDLLDARALRCLPLDREKFPEGSMFVSLFEAVREALETERLLPRFGGWHIPANNAKLAATQELRELFGPTQLTSLFEAEAELAWLSSDITQYRTSELRQYLMRELGIAEVSPETILPRLDVAFLEAQSDDWILRLYEFLSRQPALGQQQRRRLDRIPLVRLEDGSHAKAKVDDQPLAFLPGEIETGFPTVRRTVCTTDEARRLLQSLGLTEPDPVDDIVRNVLPRYRGDGAEVDVKDYEVDIRRVLKAFTTDSKGQRDKLISALRDSAFVRAVDAGDGSKRTSAPGNVYLSTERLRKLFAGVSDVLLVDDGYACLRGEDVRELLEACGATRYLKPVPVEADFTPEERREMRRAAGWEASTGGERFEDVTLRGLDELLGALPKLDAETRFAKAALLWEALADIVRRSAGAFSGEYHWFYHCPRSTTFDASFVRQLNENAWVPDADGRLRRPEWTFFEDLGWRDESFLLSMIGFKPPIIETLAKEAGFEPGVLDLLKKLGVTSVAEFEARFEIETQPDPIVDKSSEEDGTTGGSTTDGRNGSGGARGSTESEIGGGQAGEDTTGTREYGDKPTSGSQKGRTFISYVAAHPDEEERDPDELGHQVRMSLEELAIQLILSSEPQLQRTPPNNPGYDLYEAGADGQPNRWIEVKSMTGSLRDRPVGLSRTQFECARMHREAYWLYVVEHAGAGDDARIVRIQDPVGKARTFTFDRGWLDVAEVDGVSGIRPEEDRGES